MIQIIQNTPSSALPVATKPAHAKHTLASSTDPSSPNAQILFQPLAHHSRVLPEIGAASKKLLLECIWPEIERPKSLDVPAAVPIAWPLSVVKSHPTLLVDYNSGAVCICIGIFVSVEQARHKAANLGGAMRVVVAHVELRRYIIFRHNASVFPCRLLLSCSLSIQFMPFAQLAPIALAPWFSCPSRQPRSCAIH